MRALILLLYFFLQTGQYTGKILYVKDGDTFVLQTSEGNLNIRLAGIDAPEKDQEYGQESKLFLNKYLYKRVFVTNNGLDKYGRTLGVVFVEGTNINLLSVESGFAWHYKYYSKDTALANAELRARNGKRGLWSRPSPIPPWEWRRR